MSDDFIPTGKRTSAIFWILAVVITISAALYQNAVGPRRPVRGSVHIGDETIRYRLSQTHGSISDHEVALSVSDSSVTGIIEYRRYRMKEPWSVASMTYRDGRLAGWLPAQPIAGILEYRVLLQPAEGDPPVSIPPEGFAAVRFRDHVPASILATHVVLMFLGMLIANRAGLEALRRGSDPRRLAVWATALLGVGGLALGPVVQWYSFGEAWTGFPVGSDLTDNKTAIVLLLWLAALFIGRRSLTAARRLIIAAAVATLVIFSIPHSLLGTELDYSSLPEHPELPAEP
jgi:hypothetical protein